MNFPQFRHFMFVAFLIFSTTGFGQNFTLPNEEAVFAFNTQNGKKVTLNKDKANNYLIYRFGTKDKIEFEFPDKSKSSWTNFKYSFYLRGGGTQNEGMDLNYIYFTNKGFTHVIYDTYFASGNRKEIGIKIINLKTTKTTNIKGDRKKRKGALIDFRDNNLLEIGEELFD
jgi:hypothetical protein